MNEFFVLWEDSIDRFFTFLKSELPNTKVIIHKARNVKYYYDEQKVKHELSKASDLRPIDVDKFNELWNRMDEYVINRYHPKVIDIFNDKYFSYSKHPWGKLYVHYNNKYYIDFINNLHQIIIGDLQKAIVEARDIVK